MTTGQITNHMLVDATNILNGFQWIHSKKHKATKLIIPDTKDN